MENKNGPTQHNISNIWTRAAILNIGPIVFTHDIIIFVIFIFWQRATKMRQGTVHSTEHGGTTLYINKIYQRLWNNLDFLIDYIF